MCIFIFYLKGITDDGLRETAYEILLASAGASGYILFNTLASIHSVFLSWVNFPDIFCFCTRRGLIVPSKEKKKDKKSRLIRKLGRGKSDHVSHSQQMSGLVGLLETMRVQMEVFEI